MADEVFEGAVWAVEENERENKRAAVEAIAEKMVFEADRRGGEDMVKSLYGVYVEVGIFIGLMCEKIRKEEVA